MKRTFQIICAFLALVCIGVIPARASDTSEAEKYSSVVRRAPTCPTDQITLTHAVETIGAQTRVNEGCIHGFPYGGDIVYYQQYHEYWYCSHCGYHQGDSYYNREVSRECHGYY